MQRIRHNDTFAWRMMVGHMHADDCCFIHFGNDEKNMNCFHSISLRYTVWRNQIFNAVWIVDVSERRITHIVCTHPSLFLVIVFRKSNQKAYVTTAVQRRNKNDFFCVRKNKYYNPLCVYVQGAECRRYADQTSISFIGIDTNALPRIYDALPAHWIHVAYVIG